jgi:putative MATE family efflux protein
MIPKKGTHMKETKEFLGTEPIGKLLLKLAIPTVLSQVINMLYNVVDRIYIGHIANVGDLALTGVGICMPLIMIVSAFAFLASAGGAPRASIFLGEGKREEAEKTLGNCFAFQILISALLTVLLLLFSKDLLLSFGGSESTIGYATDYMRIYALGTVFVQLTLGMNAYITAQGFAGYGMISVLIGAGLNILLDPIFIFALDMGVRGAALATVISQAAACGFVLSFLLGKKSGLRIKKKNLVPEAKILLPCLALGLSPFVMQSSESIVAVCFNTSLQSYGGDIAVGAMTILTSVMQFALLPLQGLAQGAQPITSYNYGAKNPERVRKSVSLLISISLAYSFLLWGAIMLFPRAFASMFATEGALLDFTAGALHVYCAVLCIFGLQTACQMTFLALGRAKESILVAIVRKFILLMPLIYLVPTFVQNKTLGVYLAEPICDFLAVTFTAIIFRYHFKKALAKIKKAD